MSVISVLRVVRRVTPTLVLVGVMVLPLLSSGAASLSLMSAEAATSPSFIQANAAKSTSGTALSATFPSASAAGNTIVVFVVWSNTGSVAVSDTSRNTYQPATSPTAWRGGGWRAQVWYANQIQSSGSTTVTATFATPLSGSGLLYIHEYSGVDQLNPLDGTTSASGGSGALNSGTLQTQNAADLLFAGSASNQTVTAAANGYATRSAAFGNLTQDQSVTAAGSYNATAAQNGTFWVMQLVAFRGGSASGSNNPPTATSTPMPSSSAGPAAITAPLRTWTTNSHFLTDGSGRAVFLSGSHTWDDFQDTDQSNQPAAFDFNAYVNFLNAHGHNMTILWRKDLPTYCNWGAGGTWRMAQFPWPRNGGGTASDGKAKFDLGQYDQTYFDRLRARVVQLQQNNIYATVELFDGLGLLNNRCATDGYPFTGSNNVNGIDDGGGTNSMTMSSPTAITDVQDAYVRKVIDTVNDLPNVLWEISEEAPNNSQWWQNHMIGLIHSYESGKALQHPVGYPC